MKRPSEELQNVPAKARRFEHIDGNWPCHISISFSPYSVGSPSSSSNSDSEEEDLGNANVIETLATSAAPFLASANNGGHIFPVDRPFHISLSHTFVLRHHQIKLFLKVLKQELATSSSFQLVLTNAVVRFTNANHTRYFYALRAEGGSGAVRSVIKRVDKVLQRIGQPQYHKHPEIHVSFGWSEAEAPEKAEAEAEAERWNVVYAKIDQETRSTTWIASADRLPAATLEAALRVTTVTCNIGNKIEHIQLL